MSLLCIVLGHRWRLLDEQRGIAGEWLCARCAEFIPAIVWPASPPQSRAEDA